MNFLTGSGSPAEQAAVYVDTDDRGRQWVVLESQDDNSQVILSFDENHAQALVLALQAAIAEVQARAVQR